MAGQYVITLAEWGARLQAQGYQLQEPEDSHPLTWYRVVNLETGVQAASEVLKKQWEQTQKHLASFWGRTKNIQGRPYQHFHDYTSWRGRKAKGAPGSGPCRGLVLSNWNHWVAAKGGDGRAMLEGVKVSRLSSYLEGYHYHLCRDSEEAAVEKRRRESLLEELRGWKPGSPSDQRHHRRIGDWKEMAGHFLGELYSLRQAAEVICQRYFDGHQVLFPSGAGALVRLVECVEELVEGYNRDLANRSGHEVGQAPETLSEASSPNFIDTIALEKGVVPAAQLTAFLVDMAKAEALDALGENRAAVGLLDRHV